MNNTIATVSDYIFGTGLTTGIAAITGECGVEIETKLGEEDFYAEVEAFMAEDDWTENIEQLKAEFAENKSELFAEYEDYYSANLA